MWRMGWRDEAIQRAEVRDHRGRGWGKGQEDWRKQHRERGERNRVAWVGGSNMEDAGREAN